jgi:uncharacterized membrane protein
MTLSPSLWLFIVFGVLGIFGEVIFTALAGLLKTRRWRLNGESYIWMFPIYGLIAFLFDPLNQQIAGLSWIARGLIYMLAIYVVEYVTGSLLTKLTGGHIWQYTGRFNLHGQIQLAHAPVWFVVGLVVEKYYNDMEQLALWLSLHFG